MAKFLCSDYDGTLRIDGKVSKEDVLNIKKFQEEGNYFFIVSGRSRASIEKEMNLYGLKPDYLVCNNGGAIFDSSYNEFKIDYLDMDIVYKITDLLIEKKCASYSYNDGIRRVEKFLDEEVEKAHPSVNDISLEEIEANGKIAQIVGLAYDEIQAKEVANMIVEKFGDFVDCYANVCCIDVVPKGISKAIGIEFLINKLGINESDIYCVGDALNDVSMLSKYYGACMKHGAEEAKKVANIEVNSVSEYIDYIS